MPNKFQPSGGQAKRVKQAACLFLIAMMLMAVYPGAAFAAVSSPSDDGTPYTQSVWPSFQAPPVETKSMPLWFWNEEIKDMSDDMLREMVQKSYQESGYYGFGILPNWIEEYLNEAYFHKYQVVLEECYKLGMKLSLYDENGYPSYAAGGILQEKYPELTAKRLDMVQQAVAANASSRAVSLDLPYGTLMGAVAMNTSTLERINITDAADIHIVDPKLADPGTGVFTSSIYSADYDAFKAFDGNNGTRWNSQSGQHNNQWLEVRYDAPIEVDRVDIVEAMDRIGDCAVQIWNGEEYATVASATSIGGGLSDQTKSFTFDRVATTRVRFFVFNSRANNDPSITHMRVFNNGTQLPVPAQRAPEASKLTYTVPSGAWRVMAFICVTDGAWGMDYLSAESVSKFIEITHEAYYQHFPEYFPKGDLPGTGTKAVFNSSFYDEPSFTYITQGASKSSYGVQGSRAWTPGFNEDFLAQKGYDPVLNYPALWYDIGDETTQARNDLYDVRTELFSSVYIGQVNQWCADHGIELTGHMLTEERHNPVPNCGDLMKAFKRQAIPAVDVVGSYNSSREAYKIISSSAYNWDKGRIGVECFGAMGEGMGQDMLYRQTMDLYAKGINYMIPHAIWSDRNNVIHPPELSYRNPNWASELWPFNEYIGRLQQLLWDGRHVADIAMLYPIDYLESVFTFTTTTSTNSGTPSDSNYMTVGEALSLTARRDFTYLHPEVLDEKCVVTEDGTLYLDNEVNFEEYKVFVLPGMQVISLSNAQKIKAFYDAGGRVISVGQIPYRGVKLSENSEVARIMSEIFNIPAANLASSASTVSSNQNQNGGFARTIANNVNNLGAALDDALSVYDVKFNNIPATSNGYLTYIHKIKEDTDIYFLSNSTTNPMSGTVDLRGKIEPYFWDPHTGKRSAAEYTLETIDGQTVTRVSFSLGAIHSVFIVDDDLNSREIKGLEVASDIDSLGVGDFVTLSGYKQTARLTVEAVDLTDERIPVPFSQIAFESLTPDIADVSTNGAVTGISEGTAVIKASFNGYEALIELPIEKITVAAISLQADSTLLKTGSAGSAAYLTVNGVLSDGGQTDVTKLPGFAFTPSQAGLLSIDGAKVQRASGAPDSFSVLLNASLTMGSTKVTSNDLLIRALPLKNVALSANGGSASASSTYNNNTHGAATAIDGNRMGRNWGSSGGWNSAGLGSFPNWLQVTFSGKQWIDEISVYSLQDDYANGIDPAPWMTFRSYGLVDFEVQYHNGVEFIPVKGSSFTGNDLVWNRLRFDPIETDRIRVYITFALYDYSRIIELEAWEADLASVDKSELLAAYNEGKQVPEGNYPPGSWDAFSAQLTNAKALLTDSNATQTQVNDAAAALRAATAVVAFRADRSDLEAAQAAAGGVDPKEYTLETWEALKTAYDDSFDATVWDNTSQQAVDAAADALWDAFRSLKEVVLDYGAGQPAALTLKRGQVYQIKIDSNNKSEVLFFSANGNVSLSPTGLVTGVKPGVAIITVVDTWSGQFFNIVINVTN